MYPFTCARAVRATCRSHTQQGKRGESKPQDDQRNVKDQDHREQMDEAGFPGKTLAGATSAAPARSLPRASVGPLPGPHQPRHCHRSHAAASPTSWAGTCMATCSFQAKSASTCVAACRSSRRPYHHATSAACLPTWRCMLAGLGACRSEAQQQRMGRASFASPEKLMDTYVAYLMRFVP